MKKVEAVVTVLNCTLECLFTNKEVEEEYSGDIVGNYGFCYKNELDTKFNEVVDWDEFDVEEYYQALFVDKIKPLEVLGKMGWDYATGTKYAKMKWARMFNSSSFLQQLLREGK